MKKKTRRFLSILLSLVMVLSLVHVNAFAEDGEDLIPEIQLEEDAQNDKKGEEFGELPAEDPAAPVEDTGETPAPPEEAADLVTPELEQEPETVELPAEEEPAPSEIPAEPEPELETVELPAEEEPASAEIPTELEPEPVESPAEEELVPPESPEALVELSHAFILQPEGGTVPAGELYTLIWDTDFLPLRVWLFALEPGLEEPAEEVEPLQKFTDGEIAFRTAEIVPADTKLVLAAWYGEGKDDCVLSDLFTVTEEAEFVLLEKPEKIPEEPLSEMSVRATEGTRDYTFTEAATCIYYEGSSAFTVRWTTSFLPLKVEVGYYDNVNGTHHSGEGTFTAVYTEEQNTLLSMTYGLPMEEAEPMMYVRAFYTQSAFVESMFGLPLSQLGFLEEATCVYYEGSSAYTVRWKTSFKPLKVEVGYYDNVNGTHFSGEGTFTAVYTEEQYTYLGMSYGLPMEVAEPMMYVRAFYSSYGYRESMFTLPLSQLGFLEEATCVYYEGSSAFTVRWKTSFKPLKVEVGYYDNVNGTHFSGEGTFTAVYTEEQHTYLGMTYGLPMEVAEPMMYVRAFYSGYGYRESMFTLPLSQLGFLEEATCVYYEGSSAYTVRWKTSFKPLKVEVGYYGSDNSTFHAVYTEEQYTYLGMSYGLPMSEAVPEMYVRAFYSSYGYRESIITPPFSQMRFLQAAASTYNGGSNTFTVSWQTSFKPYKVEVGYYGSDNSTFHAVYTEEQYTYLGMSCSLPIEETVSKMYVRAFYGKYDYRESMFVPLRFVLQPTGGFVVPENGYHPISWSTSFNTTKIELLYRTRDEDYNVLTEQVYSEYAAGTTSCKIYWNILTPTGAHDQFELRAYYSDTAFVNCTFDGTFAARANPLPVITTDYGMPNGHVGQSYHAQLAAIGAEPITWHAENYITGMPPGLTLNSDGSITGTPTQAGQYTFLVYAQNSYGSRHCALEIIIGEPPVIASVTNLGTAYTGMDWTKSLSSYATGDGTIYWYLVDGNLPDGIYLSGRSLLYGTPTTPGLYTFKLHASNYVGDAEKDFTLLVANPAVNVSASPVSVTFPALDEGYTYPDIGETTGVVFTNDGIQNLNGLSVTIEGSGANAFELVRINGKTPENAGNELGMMSCNHGTLSQISTEIRRKTGFADGTYQANLVLQQNGSAICSVPLSFTVNDVPEPPLPPPTPVIETDQVNKTWTLHDYHSGVAGGWSLTEDGGPMMITVTNNTSDGVDVTVSITGSGAEYYVLVDNDNHFHYYDENEGPASFTMTVPRWDAKFYVYPNNVIQGADVSAVLNIDSSDQHFESSLRAIGSDPYVRSLSFTPANPTIQVYEGYSQGETLKMYTVTNTGNVWLRNVILSADTMPDPSLYTIVGGDFLTLDVGESKMIAVMLNEGLATGTYSGYLHLQAFGVQLSNQPRYTVVVNPAPKYVTGTATLVGDGLHGSPLSVELSGTPTDATPTFTWHVYNSAAGHDDKTVVAEIYTPDNRNDIGTQVYCVVTFDGYEGELQTDSIVPHHDIQLLQVYRRPSCTESGIIAYCCTVDGCTVGHTDETPALGHSLEHIDAKAANCVETGNIEHWQCSCCGDLFLDADATQATTADAVSLPVDPDNHYGGPINCDENEHWMDCACGEHIYAALHVDADNDSHCDVCMYTIEGIPIDEAHFPDPNFRAYVASNIDTDSNGRLTDTERRAVTEISCAERSIASLQGIAYFPNLDYLDCSSNHLISLDLGANTKLTELDCSYNEVLTALDLSVLPNLELFTCCGCVSLATLDVSENPDLTELDCRECALTSLDLSNNSALWYLDCSGNALTELDLSELPVLRYLMCNDNNITELDLGHPELQYIDCFRNQLTMLDLSACPALTHVNCSNDTLTELTLGEQPLLKELYCHENSLIRLDLRVCNLIKDAVLTTEGNLNEGTMIYSKNDVEFYVDPDVILVTNTYVLSGVEASSSGIVYNESLARYWLADNTRTLMWKDDNEPGFTALSSWSIGFFDSNSNNVTEEPVPGEVYLVHYGVSTSTQGQGLVDFSELTKNDCSLEIPGYTCTCYLVSTRVVNGYDTVDMYFRVIKDVPDGIPINSTNFPDEIFRSYVADNLDPDHNGYLTDYECEIVHEIDVVGKGIGSLKGIEYFCEITALDAEGNNLTALDLSENIYLRNLCLNYNSLSSLDLTGLVLLKSLEVESNNLTALNLSANTALESLSCGSNGMTALDVSHNTALMTLSCYENSLSVLDVSTLTDLEYLECNDNYLTELDLHANTALEHLNCSSNQLTEIDLSANTQLTGLYTIGNEMTELDVRMLPALHVLECYDMPLQTLKLGTQENLWSLVCYETPETFVLDISGCPLILDAYLYGTQTVTDIPGFLTYVTYKSDTNTLEIDPEQIVVTSSAIIRAYGGALSLEGDIGIKFYLVIPDEVFDDPGAYVTLNEKRLLISTGESEVVNGETMYVFKYRVAAKEMNKDVELRVFDGNGDPLTLHKYSNGADLTADGYHYTVQKYISAVLKNASAYPAKLVELVRAMSDYGSKAQMQFHYEEETAKPIYNAEEIAAVTVDTLTPYKREKITTDRTGISFTQLNLTLESETTTRLFFAVNEGSIDDYSFTVNGKAATPVLSEYGYGIEIRNIAAKDLDTLYTVEVSDALSVCLTVKCSALSYAYLAVKNADTQPQTLVELVKALYIYNQKANAYFGQ